MKKLFIYLSVAVLGIAAASCQKELAVAEGGKGNVNITIQTPEVATKAIADGMNVDIVHYEIYKKEEGHKNSLTGTHLIKGTVPMSAKGASLTLNLLQGQEYVGLFWAQVNGKNYYNVGDLRNVTVNYPNEVNNKTLANDEDRAAFCKSQVFGTGANVRVVLERPFAQINLGTSLSSIDKTVNGYDINLEQSSMTVKGVANSFNVAAMTAGETEVNVEFSYATLPYVFNPSETLVANNQTWAYAGMNYVLVPGDAATVDVTYSIKTDVGTVTRNVPVVPVKKNYRTNLLGNLLTQETTIDIVVDEKFNTPDREPAPIYMAAANGGEFTLTEDVELSEPLIIQSSLTIDLNGYTITGGKEYVSGMTGAEIAAITVENGATLTIEGNGSVTGIGFYGVYAKNGTLNVKDGNFAAKTSAVQIAAATVNIEGGTFSNSSDDKRYTINCLDGNWKDGSAKVNITGGTFVGFNPAANAAEGVGTNFCAEGYKAFEKDGVWHVVAAETNAVVLTADEFKAALAAGAGNTTVVIDANGAEFDMNGAITQANVPAGTTVTIRNANVNARSYGNKLEGTVVYENCTFNNAAGAYSIHFDGGNGHVVFKNCDLYGWNSFGEIGSVTLENCTLNGNGTYALIRSYTAMTLTNCTINLSNANHDDEWPEGVEAVEGGTLTETNVVYVVDDVTTLQYVLNQVDKSTNIKFGQDLEGNVTLVQKEKVNIDINGDNYKYDGQISIEGGSQGNSTETVKIHHVNFEHNTGSIDFIFGDDAAHIKRYAHNVTVENCSFSGNTGDVIGLRFRQAYNLVVRKCTANGIHSLAQISSTSPQLYEDCDINAGRGLNLLTSSANTVVKNCKIVSTKEDGYGIRVDAAAGNMMTVTGSEITAFEPIVLRSAASTYTLNLENTVLTSRSGNHIVVKGQEPAMNGVDGLTVKVN